MADTADLVVLGAYFGTGGKGTYVISLFINLLTPLTFTWPHLSCDVGLEEGEY